MKTLFYVCFLIGLVLLPKGAQSALLTDPNDPRNWQGATVGTFATLYYGGDTAANRQAVINDQLLDDGTLTANLTQTGVLIPTNWANTYGGCVGISHNSVYSYSCGQPKTVFEVANFIDEYWFQSHGSVGNTVFDLGSYSTQAAVFVTIDHGPIPQESIESTIYVSANHWTNSSSWSPAKVVRVYLQGYIVDNTVAGTGLYDGFVYVVRHPVLENFRYISLTNGGPGALLKDGDDEINGVVGLDNNFTPTKLPFDICLNLLASTTTGDVSYTPFPLSGRWTSTAVDNYSYNSIQLMAANPKIAPTLTSNTIMVFISQDYQNSFALNIIIDSNDGSGGSATISVKTTNLGAPDIVVYDDPTTVTITTPGTDYADTYQWYPSTGQGLFNFKWGAGTTDGVVLSPLKIADATLPFTIEVTVTSSTGISSFQLMNVVNGVTTPISYALGSVMSLRRESCTCGNGITELFEECDVGSSGGPCCTSKCKLIAGGTTCRSSAGICDVEEKCDGVNGACPADTFKPSSVICRDSVGVCDLTDKCTGSSAACPADAKSTDLCRSATDDCDQAEYCNGVNDACPADVKQPNGFNCNDTNPCSSNSTCQGGVCVAVIYDMCAPACNGTQVDSGPPYYEQCDGGVCCTSNCRFVYQNALCRASTGNCDPAEACTGSSAGCPADDSTTCINCDFNCNNHGLCVADGDWFIGDKGRCVCNPGYYGEFCEFIDCPYFANCSSCAAEPACGWCCSSQQCVAGNATGATNLFCDSWQYGYCSCNPGCVGGTCSCGKCVCDLGRAGDQCEMYIGCDGNFYNTLAELPVVDACGVCNGTNTTCIGCDGIPFGLKYDYCGVCGGDGSSCSGVCSGTNCDDCIFHGSGKCQWCASEGACKDVTHAASCNGGQWIQDTESCSKIFNLSVADIAGIGAGVVAAIVIGGIAGAVLIGFGGKKGYDAYIKNKNTFDGAQTNPMYKDDGRSGVNPFYEQEMNDAKKV